MGLCIVMGFSFLYCTAMILVKIKSEWNFSISMNDNGIGVFEFFVDCALPIFFVKIYNITVSSSISIKMNDLTQDQQKWKYFWEGTHI